MGDLKPKLKLANLHYSDEILKLSTTIKKEIGKEEINSRGNVAPMPKKKTVLKLYFCTVSISHVLTKCVEINISNLIFFVKKFSIS